MQLAMHVRLDGQPKVAFWHATQLASHLPEAGQKNPFGQVPQTPLLHV
jgi:hypothetical protein